MKAAVAISLLFLSGAAVAQAPAPATEAPKPFVAGPPLGMTVNGVYTQMTSNVRVHGAIVSAESCVWDPARKLIVVVNRGAEQMEAPNDGFVSLLHPDGSVHTPKWIGASRDGLVLNQPFGSTISNGKLYLADSDGDTADGAMRVSVVRMFDMGTGAPTGEIRVPESPWFNDIAVAADGIIYATQSGSPDGVTPMRVYRVTPQGEAKVIIEGAPLALPNGIEFDGDGNLVVVNILSPDVHTFTTGGKLLKTAKAATAGNDGIVIMADGTKYVSAVRAGGVSRIRPGQPAELIANGIPNPASMCYDPQVNQLVIPLNYNNALAFIRL